MNFEEEQAFIADLKKYVTEHWTLSSIKDDELSSRIEEIVSQRLAGRYCTIEQRISICE